MGSKLNCFLRGESDGKRHRGAPTFTQWASVSILAAEPYSHSRNGN